MAPLLAAPIALMAFAGNAAAIIDPKPEYANDDNLYRTAAACYHTSDNRLYLEAYISTGYESVPEGADISSIQVLAPDDGAAPDYADPEVMAKHLRWTYGIMDHHDFVPTSSVFHAGNSFQYDGEYVSNFNATDVQAVLFEIDWKVANDPAMRTLSCVVKLDKFRYTGGG